jgi:hypothetical protein
LAVWTFVCWSAERVGIEEVLASKRVKTWKSLKVGELIVVHVVEKKERRGGGGG